MHYRASLSINKIKMPFILANNLLIRRQLIKTIGFRINQLNGEFTIDVIARISDWPKKVFVIIILFHIKFMEVNQFFVFK